MLRCMSALQRTLCRPHTWSQGVLHPTLRTWCSRCAALHALQRKVPVHVTAVLDLACIACKHVPAAPRLDVCCRLSCCDRSAEALKHCFLSEAHLQAGMHARQPMLTILPDWVCRWGSPLWREPSWRPQAHPGPASESCTASWGILGMWPRPAGTTRCF